MKKYFGLLLLNPFVVYALVWILVLFVYSFGWSYLFPSLSNSMLIFLISTMIISVIIGFVFHRLIFFRTYEIRPDIKLINKFLNISIIIIVVEIIAVRKIPLISALLGDGSDYTEFGLPILHVLLINFMSFIFIYSFHCFRCTRNNRVVKKKMIKTMIIIIIIFLLMFNRGAIMNCFIASGFLYLATTKKIYKSLFLFGLISLSVLFVFGVLGNLRVGNAEASDVILDLGQATYEFRESIIPEPFFWAYTYIASPLSNFQHNVTNNTPPEIGEYDALSPLIIHEFTPQIISKRITSSPPPRSNLIVPYFTVRTVYGDSFFMLGWWGPFYMYIFTIFFIIVNIALVRSSSPFFLTQITIINSIIVLNIFDNMFIFMGTVPALLFPIIFSLRMKK